MKEGNARPEQGSTQAEGAVRAKEAGRVLATLIGVSEPFTAPAMWRLARLGIVPHVRVGRQLYFRIDDLRTFVANGGSVGR
jgi:hypothetical protein